MARKKVQTSAPKPALDEYPMVREHYGNPAWAIRNIGNQPNFYNGVVDVEKYQIRVEKIDEPDDVVIARLKRVWRTTERNNHHWDPVRSFAMKRFGWDYGKAMAEFPAEDNGIDYVRPTR